LRLRGRGVVKQDLARGEREQNGGEAAADPEIA
jgi:hypothetical protein